MKMLKQPLLRAIVAGAGLLYGTVAHAEPADPAPSADSASILNTDQAAALVAVSVIGETLPAELALELAKFTRDLEQNPNVEQAQAIRDQLAVTVTRTVASLGLNQLPALNGSALGVPFSPGTTLRTITELLGTAQTAAWLAGSLVAPDLAPFLLPHNIRSIATYARAVTQTVTIGRPFVLLVTPNVRVGDSFTIRTNVDTDLVTLAGIDQALVNDTIAIQAPVAAQLEIVTSCATTITVFGVSRCRTVRVATAISTPDRVIATNPTFRFAYPVNAGQFATRATGSDLLLAAYDRIGTVHSRRPAAAQFASPFAKAPGFEALVPGTSLPELATQSPPVSFFGLQTTTDAVLLNTLTNGAVASAMRIAGLEPVDVRQHPPRAPQGVLSTGVSVPRHALGLTAGYRAAEVRAQQSSFMFVRWHNLGSSTVTDGLGNVVGVLGPNAVIPPPLVLPFASAPATFYYDVPAGEYTLSNARTDAQGGVFVVDYGVAADAPPVVFPPTVPSLGGVLGGLGGVLGGGTLPQLPVPLPTP